MTNGAEPVAPGGGHSSQAGAGFDAGAADDDEPEVMAVGPPVRPEETPAPPAPELPAAELVVVVLVRVVVVAEVVVAAGRRAPAS